MGHNEIDMSSFERALNAASYLRPGQQAVETEPVAPHLDDDDGPIILCW